MKVQDRSDKNKMSVFDFIFFIAERYLRMQKSAQSRNVRGAIALLCVYRDFLLILYLPLLKLDFEIIADVHIKNCDVNYSRKSYLSIKNFFVIIHSKKTVIKFSKILNFSQNINNYVATRHCILIVILQNDIIFDCCYFYIFCCLVFSGKIWKSGLILNKIECFCWNEFYILF